MNDEQKTLVNHIADLDKKIASMRFNIDQLTVGRGAFVNMLSEALKMEEGE
jgi:hypothetical protein